MKKAKKVLALAACAVLLVTASVMGTLAYLTANDSVTNTFTVGNVAITMDESKVTVYGEYANENGVKVNSIDEAARENDGNEYKLIPGHTYIKDPTIYVDEDSEDCWLFVKIENGLGNAGDIDMNAGWVETGTEGYWACEDKVVVDKNNVENNKKTPFTSFTFDSEADPSEFADAKIVVTAYAIQADNLGTYDVAWAALANQDASIPDVPVTP